MAVSNKFHCGHGNVNIIYFSCATKGSSFYASQPFKNVEPFLGCGRTKANPRLDSANKAIVCWLLNRGSNNWCIFLGCNYYWTKRRTFSKKQPHDSLLRHVFHTVLTFFFLMSFSNSIPLRDEIHFFLYSFLDAF